jgi:CheY-like chemotaxis protein
MSRASSADVDKTQVLVIEDDVDQRDFVVALVETSGMEAVAVSNGQEALAYLLRLGQRSLPSVILLDLLVPVMSGRQFLRERSRWAGLDKIPVIVVSADKQCHETARLGAVAVVEKPFQPLSLVRLIQATARGAADN